MRKIAIILVCFFILFNNKINASEFSEHEKIFNFAEELFKEKDYYGAITEYKRFIYFFPDNLLSPRAKYKIGLCYYNGGKLDQAMELFRSLNNAFPDKDEGKSSLMKLADCYFQKKEYKLAINELNNFIEDNPKEPKIRSIYFKTGLYALYDENLITAKENFNKIENEELNSAIPEYEKLPHKSPFLAGTFSAVLPGAGQIYTERYADGIMSFLFNGMFIWGAVESFQNGQNVTGGILTFFELGWYSGNIYNAVNNAHKFNKRQKTDFIEKLKDKYPAIKDISLNSSGLELDF